MGKSLAFSAPAKDLEPRCHHLTSPLRTRMAFAAAPARTLQAQGRAKVSPVPLGWSYRATYKSEPPSARKSPPHSARRRSPSAPRPPADVVKPSSSPPHSARRRSPSSPSSLSASRPAHRRSPSAPPPPRPPPDVVKPSSLEALGGTFPPRSAAPRAQHRRSPAGPAPRPPPSDVGKPSSLEACETKAKQTGSQDEPAV